MDTGAYLGKKGWILGHILGEITDLEFENHKNGGRSALSITDPCSVVFFPSRFPSAIFPLGWVSRQEKQGNLLLSNFHH